MDEDTIEKIKKMMREHDEKEKALKKKDVTKEPYGDELKPEPKPKKKPKPKPEPESDDIKISKDDFRTLIEMAKKGDVAEKQAKEQPMPEQIPERTVPEAPTPQPQQQPDQFEQVVTPTDFNMGQISTGDDDYADILKRPMVLYFDTDRTCSIVQAKIQRDGSVKIHDRMFDFTEGQPSVIKFGGRGGKTHPFYILKYDNMLPIDLIEYPPSNPTPEETTRLVDLKTLETLSQIAGAKMKKGPLIILMLASFFGGIVLKLVLGLLGIW